MFGCSRYPNGDDIWRSGYVREILLPVWAQFAISQADDIESCEVTMLAGQSDFFTTHMFQV
jgi:hypothetical protein